MGGPRVIKAVSETNHSLYCEWYSDNDVLKAETEWNTEMKGSIQLQHMKISMKSGSEWKNKDDIHLS